MISSVINSGNIITMIAKSLYNGFNNISVGVFGVPVQYVGIFLGSIAFLLILLAIVTGFRRKNSFSLSG